MNFISSFLLGMTQALTEFLPISSSAHLILARSVLHFEAIDGLTFDVSVHFGTLLAVVIYFRHDLARLANAFLSSITRPRLREDVNQRMAWYIVAANIPVIAAGLLLEQQIKTYMRNPEVIIVTLVLGAALFLATERLKKHESAMTSLTLKGALIIGVAQTLALIPGVSRSGITIAIGLTQGLKREEAARFSFLLAVPVLFGAGSKKAIDATISGGFSSDQIGVLVVGAVTSAVAGWLILRFLMRFLHGHRLDTFAYYRLVLAASLTLYLLLR